MNELLTYMKKYADECKEQVKELDLEQIKALEERFDAAVIKGIEENPLSLNPENKEKVVRIQKPKLGICWIGL